MKQRKKLIAAATMVLVATPIQAYAGACSEAIAAHTAPLSKAALGAIWRLKPKAETETTSGFIDRLTKIATTHVVISFPVIALTTYDADTGLLHVPASAVVLTDVMIFPAGSPNYFEGITLLKSRKAKGRYVGQNGFGATANVDMADIRELAIGWPMQHGIGPSMEFTIPVVPKDLTAIRKHLSVLLVADLIPPFLIDEERISGATIDAPTDLVINTRLIATRPVCVSVYDASSGTIFGEWPR